MKRSFSFFAVIKSKRVDSSYLEMRREKHKYQHRGRREGGGRGDNEDQTQGLGFCYSSFQGSV